MKSHVRVLVIGGGVVGCSVLYHLTKLGCKEVALCERKELTAGSSWHAAGGFHALNGDPGVARLQSYTIQLYREIEKLSGQDVGLHFTGGLNIAATPERWETLRADFARHQVLGIKSKLVSPEEISTLCPLIDASTLYGAIFDPMEGHLDPSGATRAFAIAARRDGAEIYRQTRVLGLAPTGNGTWRVETDQGIIEAEHVVNAAGLWAREVGKLAGATLPLIPIEHHYLITEDIPALLAAERELPLVVDLDGEIYLRQERRGILLGVYEKEATPWAANGTPWDYGETDLLPPQLDRLTESLEKGFSRFPAIRNAGIRRIVNGPFTFTPDGNPLVGPVPGIANYWAACGVMAGFAQGGGVGLTLAEWIIHGEPSTEVFAMDVARFGPYASPAYVTARAREFYSRRFQIAYPNEQWPAGRPALTSPLYDVLKSVNAVYGVSYGLEVPLYFAGRGETPHETPTLRRSNAFARVAEECQAVRENVGVMDYSFLGRYEVHGPAAPEALGRLLAGDLPAVGRCRLTPMLSSAGRLMGDLTTMRLSEDRFWITGSGYLQNWHMRWFNEHLAPWRITVVNLSGEFCCVSVCGPKSGQILARLGVEISALPFMGVGLIDMEFAPAVVARLSVTGEIGYEVHVPAFYLRPLYAALRTAAGAAGVTDFGVYALNSLRLEKSFGIWSREFSRDYTPSESGLSRFVAYDKPHFVGRDAALRDRDEPPKRCLVTLEVDATDADAVGYEPIIVGHSMVGFVTSGGYAHSVRKSLAMGYINSEHAHGAWPLEVTIAGERRRCRVLTEAAVDPGGRRVRAK
jgi:dimethylglycine dehydrogenase